MKPEARPITPEEVGRHDGAHGRSFWCVVDGYVVDATRFVEAHPGGVRKLMSANTAGVGHTGTPFGFSFSRGRNAHFPATADRFRNGLKHFLEGGQQGEAYLPPAAVSFPPHGQVVILGRLMTR